MTGTFCLFGFQLFGQCFGAFVMLVQLHGQSNSISSVEKNLIRQLTPRWWAELRALFTKAEQQAMARSVALARPKGGV